ncbi:hypothetical protein SAY87_015529 [Trapa incisa]|uniref:Sas10 C-terminal domain-containing protein n=1 Tax=Trapa incisa TaxID=236973 RepID=A0AAN7JMA6_9MYRT|nr:hypothetical protein SAY87_015529 [Trapa incisa]
MGKRGRSAKKDNKSSKRRPRDVDVNPEDMDDEIDVFHKQRDVVPLNIHSDSESDDDQEEPIFDLEEADDDDTELTGLASKIVRQQKFLREKMGGADDEMDEEEGEEKDHSVWSRSKKQYYDADEATSSDDELAAEEEAEVLRMQREKAKYLLEEDFGLENISEDEPDREPTLGEMAENGEGKLDPVIKDLGHTSVSEFEEIKKDLNTLSMEEKMDVVYSSAPELVGLLLELKFSVEELENKVNPLISKVKSMENPPKEGLHYLEVKQTLLLLYCQAITFYLLRKSEGEPVRDHPVMGRLVDIKSLLDKIKEIDKCLPPDIDQIIDANSSGQKLVVSMEGKTAIKVDSPVKEHDLPVPAGELRGVENQVETLDGENLKKEKPPIGQFGVQSMKMLKVRAALEEKLRQKDFSSSNLPRLQKKKIQLKTVNRMLETRDDFDDDAGIDEIKHGFTNENASVSISSKISSVLSMKKKPKIISGDADLPNRDDIGERRRKHELRVLSGAGILPDNEGESRDSPQMAADPLPVLENSESEESENEFYEHVKQQRAAKIVAKAEKYSRTSKAPALPETVDGKRSITFEMEKNRGLTRPCKKISKNPRKKYRMKHQKAVVRRKGQVREIRRASGSYGGESTGINPSISRSVRFKY